MRLIAAMVLALSGIAHAQTLTVSPTDATAPARPTLTWDFTGGSSCTSTGNWGGAKAATGTLTLGDFPVGTHTFTLSCQFPGVVDGTATLTWVPPTQNTDGSALTNLAGYRIKYGASPTALGVVVDVPNPSLAAYPLNNLTVGTWYFGMTAYNLANAESVLSNVASKTIAQAAPQTVSRTVTWIVRPEPVPNPPSNLAFADAQIAELNGSLVFKVTATGKRSAEVVGIVPLDTQCSGNVLFYYRDKPYRKVPASAVRWWPGIVPGESVAAQCKSA